MDKINNLHHQIQSNQYLSFLMSLVGCGNLEEDF